jgi:hypothetical protein
VILYLLFRAALYKHNSMEAHVFVVFNRSSRSVMGIFSTYEKSQRFVAEKVAACWDKDEFVIYKETLDEPHTFGEEPVQPF